MATKITLNELLYIIDKEMGIRSRNNAIKAVKELSDEELKVIRKELWNKVNGIIEEPKQESIQRKLN